MGEERALAIGGPHISPTPSEKLVSMIRTARTCGCPVCTMQRDAEETELEPQRTKL